MLNLKSRYSFLQRFNFETLTNTFLGLQPREQIYALAGAGLAILLIFGLPISLASSKLGKLESQITEGGAKQREIARELEIYRKVRTDLEGAEKKISGGVETSLTQTLVALAEKSGIKDRVDNINEKKTSLDFYDEEVVEFRLSKVTLQQLLDFLYSIEKNPEVFLRVSQIQVKRNYSNKQLIDIPFIRVAAYRLQKT